MSQVFDALQRSGVLLPGLEATSETTRDLDANNLDQSPAFRVEILPERRLVALAKEHSAAAERIRMLSVRLRRLQQQQPIKTVLITSSIKDEGKSVLSSNLAISLAKAKQRVLLLDGDCHQGGLARLLGTSQSPGLTGWWRSGDSVFNYIRRVSGVPLWFLAAGEPSTQTAEMLQSGRMSDMLAQAASWVDWVIVDSPPFAPLADSAIWVNMTDATLLLVRVGKTPKKLLGKVLESIDHRKLLGVVLNECNDRYLRYYTHYYKGASDEQANGPQT